jgi:hypothetical protein
MLAIIKAIGRGIRIFWTEPPRCEYCRHWRGKHRVCPAPAGRRATPDDKAECRVLGCDCRQYR